MNNDSDFEAKLPLYKTAYSPVYQTCVGIERVRKDERGEFIIEARLANLDGLNVDSTVLFRPSELTNFVL